MNEEENNCNIFQSFAAGLSSTSPRMHSSLRSKVYPLTMTLSPSFHNENSIVSPGNTWDVNLAYTAATREESLSQNFATTALAINP